MEQTTLGNERMDVLVAAIINGLRDRVTVAAAVANMNPSQRALIACAVARRGRGLQTGKPGLSYVEANTLIGVSNGYASLARILLDRGASEQIQQIISGRLTMQTAWKNLQGTTPRQRLDAGRDAGVKTRKQTNALWRTLRESLRGLTSLPDAREVARAVLPNRRYQRDYDATKAAEIAVRWLTTFLEASHAQEGRYNGTGAAYAGDGDADAGAQPAQPPAV